LASREAGDAVFTAATADMVPGFDDQFQVAAEVETWLQSRRQLGGVDAVKKAPVPDFRKRQRRISTGNK